MPVLSSLLRRSAHKQDRTSNTTQDDNATFTMTLLAQTREEISRADSKASLLLSAAGLGITVLVSALVDAHWSPRTLPIYLMAAWWLGVFSAAMSLVSLGIAVYPRTRRIRSNELRAINYYNDVLQFANTAELLDEIRITDVKPLERLADQLWQLGHIVERKYRYIRVAIWLLALAVVLCLIATVPGQY